MHLLTHILHCVAVPISPLVNDYRVRGDIISYTHSVETDAEGFFGLIIYKSHFHENIDTSA